mmetsp:Transcript_25202/g.36881  ORF Transcript_25202/g.36881 Transcript_25202/m.36881 type:complete len:144 (+) Transcript_25202:176-607(+)
MWKAAVVNKNVSCDPATLRNLACFHSDLPATTSKRRSFSKLWFISVYVGVQSPKRRKKHLAFKKAEDGRRKEEHGSLGRIKWRHVSVSAHLADRTFVPVWRKEQQPLHFCCCFEGPLPLAVDGASPSWAPSGSSSSPSPAIIA